MAHVHSFAAIGDAAARVLILGTMPGVMSLKEQQYYAHSSNVFWRIMGELVQAGREMPYESRVETLRARGIAVWDVLKCCTRQGSLDSDIDDSTIEANDFELFYREHPKVERVYFNGGKAKQVYDKHVGAGVAGQHAQRQYMLLPSTSPANTVKSFDQKLAAWQVIISKA